MNIIKIVCFFNFYLSSFNEWYLYLFIEQFAVEFDPLVLKKYADIVYQSADILIDGLNSLSENRFNYSFYDGNNPFDKSRWVGGEGFICPSQVSYARPFRAKNIDDKWRVIVQQIQGLTYFTQTQRLERCLVAESGCRTLAPCYRSRCVQKYVYHRMLSFDPCQPYKGLFIDVYKLPSGCSCHIPSSSLKFK